MAKRRGGVVRFNLITHISRRRRRVRRRRRPVVSAEMFEAFVLGLYFRRRVFESPDSATFSASAAEVVHDVIL